MKIAANIFKSKETGGYYAAEVPCLGIHTQGKSLKDSIAMLEDAVTTTIGRKGFRATIKTNARKEFMLSVNQPKLMLAAIIRQARLVRGLTPEEVAKRMGQKSVTGLMRYERGEVLPSLEKLAEILVAIDPDLEPVLMIG